MAASKPAVRTTTALLLAAAVVLGACSDDGDDAADDVLVDPPRGEGAGGTGGEADGGGSGAGTAGTGTLVVRLEETEGILIEGFELGFRIEAADGEVLDEVVWSDVVAGLDPDSPAAHDGAAYEASVPAGPVVVRAQVNLGIGPPPAPVDPGGDLACELEVDVPEGGAVAVEVALTGDAGCLRLA